VPNTRDPLVFFNDAGFHRECFAGHPLAAEVEARVAEFYAQTGPGHRGCAVCGEEIRDPDDYLGLDHLTGDAESPLYRVASWLCCKSERLATRLFWSL
jgi:hypothetical protein